MKKLTFLLVGLLGLTMASCSDEDPSINIYGTEKITTPAVLEALPAPAEYAVVENTNEADKAGTFTWTAATLEYDGAVAYYVQIAPKGSDFSQAVDVFTESVSTTSKDFTFGDLNDAVNRLNALLVANAKTPIEFGSLSDIDVRIKAIAAVSQAVSFSAVQSIKVNAYEKIIVVTPHLYLVGAPQAHHGGNAWDPSKGIELKYIGDGTTKVFECYVQVMTGEGFKFTGDGKTWDNGNYGTDGAVAAVSGGQEFTLINSGASADLKVADVDGNGLYYVKVDMDAMTCKVIKMQWGVIGAATAGGWGAETAMVYSFSANEWSYTGTDITAGEMKFRSSNTGLYINGTGKEWTYNVGQALFVGDGGTGANFNVTAGAQPKLKVGFDGTCVVSGL
ncbi:SusE domain-containing protein [Flavobacterium taihuense]|uniref:SusE domain-containing protein n=1 Tax=Flavobacterium taihuense TaxID=2857508 RepID=A0ABS6XZ94_9FLAO|nr:SusE domain-containing protein [Flavobacterium taihuense]MBW4362000.1 SusE domain-containing protein [Flavobacterium taihuense]